MDTSVAAEKPPLLTTDFNLLLLASIMGFIAIGMFYLFPLYVMDLGGTKSDIGILMGIMALSAVGVRPWVSGLVDRFGRKSAFRAGSLLMGLAAGAHILFTAPIDDLFFTLVLLRFVYGVGLGFVIVSSLTYATDLVPRQRLNEGLGIFGVMPLLGIAIGPVIGEVIKNRYGFSGMFLGVIAACILTILILQPVRQPVAAIPTPQQGGFFTVLGSPSVWRMGLVVLSFGVAFAAHGGFVAPFAESLSLRASVYFIAYSSAAVLSRLFGGRLAQRFGEHSVIAAALLVICAGFFWLVQVETHWGLAITGMLAGAGHGIFFPTVMALCIRSVSAEDRGKVTGVITGSVDAGMLLGSFALGILGDFFGFGVLFATAAGVVLGGWLFFLVIKSHLTR